MRSQRLAYVMFRVRVKIPVLTLARALTSGTQTVFEDLNPASHRIGREQTGGYLVTSKRIKKPIFRAIRVRGKSDRKLGDNSGFTAGSTRPARVAMVR